MTPSPCANCGKTVMPYRKYFWYFHPKSACHECGAEMEMRAWRGLLLIGVLLLGVFVATLLVTQAERDWVACQIDAVEAVIGYRRALLNLCRLEGTLLDRRRIQAPGTTPIPATDGTPAPTPASATPSPRPTP